MTFRLMIPAKKNWRELDGAFRLPEIIEGVAFKDGIKQKKMPPDYRVTNFRACSRPAF